MKKALYAVAVIATIAIALAQGEINPLCENGCIDNGNGCLCKEWFPTYREYEWK